MKKININDNNDKKSTVQVHVQYTDKYEQNCDKDDTNMLSYQLINLWKKNQMKRKREQKKENRWIMQPC